MLGVFAVIERAYSRAVERLPEDQPERGFIDRPDEKLAEHLVWCAVMSAIPIDEPGLWQAFWNQASQHLRQHAVEHLGRMFERATNVPAEVQGRVEQLWAWIAVHVDEKQRAKTLAPFGWLLAAPELDDGGGHPLGGGFCRLGSAGPDGRDVSRSHRRSPADDDPDRSQRLGCLGL
jgi:hypothetical protein